MAKSTTNILHTVGLTALSALLLLSSAKAQTILVDPQGEIRTITEALEIASDGDEIIISEGVYAEPTLVIDKSVALTGRGDAVLDGQGDHQIMTVTAPDVRISGLTLRNVSVSFMEDRAAIKVNKTARCVIEDNRIENTFFAIYLAQTSDCEIRRNTIVGSRDHDTETHSGNGIHIWYSIGVVIEDNHISGHRDGLYFEFVERTTVRRNVSELNLRYGLHFMFSDDCTYTDNVFRKNNAGVAVMYTKNVVMRRNRFEENWGSAAYGLLLKDITDSEVVGNTFESNTVGIHAEGSNRITVTDNHFWRNGWAVRVLANCVDILFSRNNFGGNTFDVATNGRSIDSRFVENYWDNYEGYDLDKDGFGDVPFRPVTLFSMIVQQNEPSLILLHSLFVRLLDAAERMLPAITPVTLVDPKPRMRRIS